MPRMLLVAIVLFASNVLMCAEVKNIFDIIVVDNIKVKEKRLKQIIDECSTRASEIKNEGVTFPKHIFIFRDSEELAKATNRRRMDGEGNITIGRYENNSIYICDENKGWELLLIHELGHHWFGPSEENAERLENDETLLKRLYPKGIKRK